MKRIRCKLKKLLVCILIFCTLFSRPVYVAEARENCYIATLFDDKSLKWIPVVMYSGDEIEKTVVTGACFMDNVLDFMQTPEQYSNFGTVLEKDDANKIITKLSSNTGEISIDIISNGIRVYDTTQISENPEDCASAPLTFPAYGDNATEADINRAYVVSTTLGNSLNEALLFLNDGEAFINSDSSEDYFLSLTYQLLSSNNESVIKNEKTGKNYSVKYNSNNGTCTIKILETGEKETFVYRLQKGYYLSKNLVDNANVTSIKKERNDYRKYFAGEKLYSHNIKDGSKLLQMIEDEENALPDVIYDIDETLKFSDDGSVNVLSHTDYSLMDTEYVNWFQMVTEAQILKSQGYTYSNQSDLLGISSGESSIVNFFRKMLNGLQSLLNCFSLNQLIFNEGTRGSMAYLEGIFPSQWLDNVSTIYLISSVIAYALLAVAMALSAIRANLATASPSVRHNLLEGIKDIIIVAFVIAFFYPLMRKGLTLCSLFVDIWANASTNFTSLQEMSNNTGVIAGVIVQIAYFVITLYMNFVYIIRGIVVALLMATAPLFIVCIAFGPALRKVTSAWFKELIGNILLQPVHAVVIAFLMSVNVGLRGIEAIVFTACLIPVTTMYKSLISQGGNVASKLGGTLSGGAISMGAGVASGVASAGSGAIDSFRSANIKGTKGTGGEFKNKFEAPTKGGSITTSGVASSGLPSKSLDAISHSSATKQVPIGSGSGGIMAHQPTLKERITSGALDKGMGVLGGAGKVFDVASGVTSGALQGLAGAGSVLAGAGLYAGLTETAGNAGIGLVSNGLGKIGGTASRMGATAGKVNAGVSNFASDKINQFRDNNFIKQSKSGFANNLSTINFKETKEGTRIAYMPKGGNADSVRLSDDMSSIKTVLQRPDSSAFNFDRALESKDAYTTRYLGADATANDQNYAKLTSLYNRINSNDKADADKARNELKRQGYDSISLAYDSQGRQSLELTSGNIFEMQDVKACDGLVYGVSALGKNELMNRAGVRTDN